MKIDTTLHLEKMRTELNAEKTAQYFIEGNTPIHLNRYLGRKLRIQSLGQIRCISCGRHTTKSFNQGYCFVCFKSKAACDLCILKPELCHYAEGTCREPHWGKAHCLKPHYIYLANTAKIKVGITREQNTPMRWIDQGAVQALPILKVSERYLSGVLEVLFKRHVSDKTHWQAMLKAQPETLDLQGCQNALLTQEADALLNVQATHGENALEVLKENTLTITYPVLEYPEKVKSLNLDKTPLIEGLLLGIKGQYLMLDSGVFNARKFAGYYCRLSIE